MALAAADAEEKAALEAPETKEGAETKAGEKKEEKEEEEEPALKKPATKAPLRKQKAQSQRLGKLKRRRKKTNLRSRRKDRKRRLMLLSQLRKPLRRRSSKAQDRAKRLLKGFVFILVFVGDFNRLRVSRLSWQVQYFVDLAMHILGQVQEFVDVEGQRSADFVAGEGLCGP